MTKLYPSAVGVAYTPTTIRGAWERTTGHAVCGMGSAKDLSGLGGPLSIASAETVNTTDYDVLLLRCVSAPLAADHSFSGTMNVMMAVQESNKAHQSVAGGVNGLAVTLIGIGVMLWARIDDHRKGLR